MDKVLKNSTPGKIAYILQSERVQPDATEFDRTQIHFLGTFSLVSTSFLKLPIHVYLN